jgi:hypothetical protein
MRTGMLLRVKEKLMNSIKLLKLRFTLTFTGETHLPPFVGNTLRGALGRALCDNFPVVYEAVFKVAGGESTPNPFTISAPYPGKESYHIGENMDFSLTLFGSACVYEDEIINAAKLMCNGKLSHAKLTATELEYSREWSDAGAESITPCNFLRLQFISPTQILSGKVSVYAPDFGMFIDSLLGRISAITDNYGEKEFTIPYSLIARKPFVRAEYDTKRLLITTNKQPIGGFVGTICYLGDVTRYLPYIDLGSQLHLGKKTTRSCGEYTFEISYS